ncbi:MAG TPA: hypothetical protein VI700_05305 [Thermoanaerobaculaceae bacterium]|nr:hypothetical protein [Thermoanaerobaculaceae bacterium]
MRESFRHLVTLAAAMVVAAPLLAQEAAVAPPPSEAVRRACDAAGGMAAFNALGVVEVKIKREEVTQEGQTTAQTKGIFFLAPGPTPGRTEDPQIKVIAGDDGSGGWAVVGGQVDSRPSTIYMVKRLLTAELFPLLLPFSLTWEGATVTAVVPAEVGGQPVWRLTVVLTRTFFFTPQISTSWTVDLHRRSFALVRAESPATDLGKGVKADGMRFLWSDPVRVGNISLPGVQRLIGLDEIGREKSHSRIDHVTYRLLPAQSVEKLFANPIPPEQRPNLPVMQPPARPDAKPGA